MTYCDDCGDECKRRMRCPRCGMMLCGWCWHHIHSLQIETAEMLEELAEKIKKAKGEAGNG